jgi:lysophospholipase L1-like esterase
VRFSGQSNKGGQMASIRTAALAMVMGGAATLASAAPPSAPGILALGDSVPFGYIANDGPAYFNSNNFIGYPDYAGEDLRLGTTNAACPGESSVTFISSAALDPLGQLGCRAFRAKFPLHVSYTSTQLEFATNFLRTHKQTRLVTIGLGSNDVFGCGIDPACFQTVLPQLSVNMAQILQSLRATGFRGVIIVVNYYSLDYSNPLITGLVTSLNGTLATVAKAHGAVVADVFTAFQKAALTTGQNPCKAGLLNGNPLDLTQTSCDIHPSQSGHQLIADTVEATFKAPSHGV